MELRDRLAEACKKEEIITVLYNGGSQPGTKRRIIPIKVSVTQVRAKCFATGEIRTYNLSKLELVSESYPVKAYDPTAESEQSVSMRLKIRQLIESSNILATSEQINHAGSLGITLSQNVKRIEVVIALLSSLADKHHIAKITCPADMDDNPWTLLIEPYTFQMSREGLRLRCWVYAPESPLDQSYYFSGDTEGWHLYRIEEIESVHDTQRSFQQRQYREHSNDLTFTLRIDTSGLVIETLTE